jgi:hypothetical protein
MPYNLGPKILKMKKGDIVSSVQGNLKAVHYKGKWVVYVLTNIRALPAEENFRDDTGNAVKPLVIEDCNIHMGYMDRSDQMATSCVVCRRAWKGTKKLFFHLVDLVIISAVIIDRFCGGIMTHK